MKNNNNISHLFQWSKCHKSKFSLIKKYAKKNLNKIF